MSRSNFEAAQPPILIDNGVAILENEKIGTEAITEDWKN